MQICTLLVNQLYIGVQFQKKGKIEDSLLYFVPSSQDKPFLQQLLQLLSLQLDYPFTEELEQDLQILEGRFAFLEYLATEIVANRVNCSRSHLQELSKSFQIKLGIDQSSVLLKRIESACHILDIELKVNVAKELKIVLAAMSERIENLLKSLAPSYLEPLIKFELTKQMMELLEKVNQKFQEEYKRHRQIMLTRLHTTAGYLLETRKLKTAESGDEHRTVIIIRSEIDNLIKYGAHTSFSIEFDLKNARDILVSRLVEKTSSRVKPINTPITVPSVAKNFLVKPAEPVPQVFDKKKKKKKKSKQTFSAVSEQNRYATQSVPTSKREMIPYEDEE